MQKNVHQKSPSCSELLLIWQPLGLGRWAPYSLCVWAVRYMESASIHGCRQCELHHAQPFGMGGGAGLCDICLSWGLGQHIFVPGVLGTPQSINVQCIPRPSHCAGCIDVRLHRDHSLQCVDWCSADNCNSGPIVCSSWGTGNLC